MNDNDDFPRDIFLEQFAEIYHGVPNGNPTWIVSNEQGSGVFGSIEDLTAEQASAKPCGGLSIAAHVEHLRWSFSYSLAFFRGEHPSPNWSGSWSVDEVDEGHWRQLQHDLKTEYHSLVGAIEAHDDWSNRAMRAGTLALVPHGAYHLGAIRLLRKNLGDSRGQLG